MDKWMTKTAASLAVVALAGLSSAALGGVPNDACRDATLVTDGVFIVSLEGTTAEAKSTGDSGSALRDVWFEYVATQSGFLALEVPGSDGNGKLSVWDACPGEGVELGYSFPADGPIDSMFVQVVAGERYLIRVADRGATTDDFELLIQSTPLGGGKDAGADVQLSGMGSLSRYGPVTVMGEPIWAYAIGSRTCNLGDANLLWTNRGTPGLAMNLYRLDDGRLRQIGLSWIKTACCAAAGSGCGLPCNGAGGSVLGSGCLDVYGSGWNGQQQYLGPRSTVNAFTGAGIVVTGASSGDAIYKRLQVRQADMDSTTYPTALYFFEGVYAASDDAVNGNWYNNATYQRATHSSFNFTLVGTPSANDPAILAWRRNGLGAGVVDPSVVDGQMNVPGEGRFYYSHKVTDLGGGNYRYDYAVYNLNSDRSGGSFSVPVPSGVSVTNVGFHSPFYHSGEPYDNSPWISSVGGGAVTWRSPQTHAENPNSNALRWATMYNFWFEANSGPGNGLATLGLFKPGTPSSIGLSVRVPNVPILTPGDMNCDGLVNFDDIEGFVLAVIGPAQYLAAYPGCVYLNGDIDGDGWVTFDDIEGFVGCVVAGGC